MMAIVRKLSPDYCLWFDTYDEKPLCVIKKWDDEAAEHIHFLHAPTLDSALLAFDKEMSK
jgi:hypothetical protein